MARAQTCRGIAARRPRRLTVAAAGGQIDDWAGRQFTLLSTSEGSTAHLAELLAGGRTAGDAYCLKGDAGAGKSAFW